jgi:hypothetical protein
MPTAMPTQTITADYPQAPGHALRPVLLTVLTLKLAVAAFLLASVSLSPPLSAESRYLADDQQIAAVR